MKKKKVTLLDTGQRNVTIAIVLGPTPTDIKRNKRKQYMKNWYKKNRKRLLEKYRRNRKHILEQKREYHSRPEVKIRVALYNKNRVRVIAHKKRKQKLVNSNTKNDR